MNLYELTADMRELMTLLEMAEDDDAEIILDTAEGTEGAFNDKVESYCKVLRNLEAEAEILSAEAQRFIDKAKVVKNHCERLKKAMFTALTETGKTEAGGDLFKAKIKKNGGLAPLKLDLDIDDIPDEFCKVERVVNTKAIRDQIAAEGFSPFGHLEERGTHLEVK